MSKIETAKQLAAKNLLKLMAENESLNRLEKIASKSGIGRGTVDRMKKAQVAVTLDTLDVVAKAFKLQPWQLIHPDLGIVNTIEDEQEAQLLADFRAASPSVKAVIVMAAKISGQGTEPEQKPQSGGLLQIRKK